MALTGCDEPTAPKPVFASTTEGDIAVPAGGGDFSITYSLENPAEDGQVRAVTEQSAWITDLNCETSGSVTFKVTPNEIETTRGGEITVLYEYPGDTQSFTVKIVQAAKGSDPVLTLTSESEMEAEAEGGNLEITFTLENPAEDGELKAESDGWIATTINETTINVAVAANDSEEAREGTITVTYAWSGEPLSFTVKVIQKGILGEAPFTIEIPENGIKINSVRVITTRLDNSITWHSDVLSQEEYDLFDGDMEAYFRYVLEDMSAYYGYTIEEILKNGFLYDKDNEDYTYTNLESETAYKAYAVGADYEGNITTQFCLKDFTTLAMTITDLTFEIETVPQAKSVLMDVYPSDKEAAYFARVIDDSWYDAGYSDEEIMMEHIDYYWDYLFYYDLYFQGDIKGHLEEGLSPETDYYAIAFGLDLDNQVYNSSMTKVGFTTTAEQDIPDDGLTFEIETTPQARSVLMDVYPSDKNAVYFTTVIDDSWYEAGYSDEEIMMQHIDYYYYDILYYGLYFQGDIKEHLEEGLYPETDYYAIAFGLDLNNMEFNSAMTKVEFTTTAEQTGASVTGKPVKRPEAKAKQQRPEAASVKKQAEQDGKAMKAIRK